MDRAKLREQISLMSDEEKEHIVSTALDFLSMYAKLEHKAKDLKANIWPYRGPDWVLRRTSDEVLEENLAEAEKRLATKTGDLGKLLGAREEVRKLSVEKHRRLVCQGIGDWTQYFTDIELDRLFLNFGGNYESKEGTDKMLYKFVALLEGYDMETVEWEWTMREDHNGDQV